MKKSLKILIPLLLVIVILGSIVWYLFVYDRDFTRDMLLSQARYNETNGNRQLSSWFYNLAYNYSDKDENVAIELANQYKAAGNYTKAEYTLSNAIADGGTQELYIALCKTYVEQDKLLDAVAMLDNITDPVIRSQLDALRPKLPTVAPDPGFYNEYIDVKLSSEGETLYYTLNGEYPSTEDLPYDAPITLPAGETKIYALAVADNGLVSPLSILSYTVGGVIEPVTFADAAVEAAVREMLNVDSDYEIYTNELWTIEEFVLPKDAESCQDLLWMPYLKKLTIQDKTLDDLQFLSNLTDLEGLTMDGCRFPAEELSVIGKLPKLQHLSLQSCALSTLAGLENAQNLTYLNLSHNTVRNIEPLSALMALAEIDLSHNALTNLSALSGLTALQKLNVSYNSLTSIAPVAGCVKLAWLDAGNNALQNLNAAQNLANLSYLAAAHNGLTDISSLAGCDVLAELDIANNAITDISVLAELPALEVVNFAYNEVTEMPAWSSNAILRSIDGSHNQISSISPLGGLSKLTHVYMDYNPELASVNALANCYCLVMVNVYGTKVEEISALTEHNIIVNYDPT